MCEGLAAPEVLYHPDRINIHLGGKVIVEKENGRESPGMRHWEKIAGKLTEIKNKVRPGIDRGNSWHGPAGIEYDFQAARLCTGQPERDQHRQSHLRCADHHSERATMGGGFITMDRGRTISTPSASSCLEQIP